MRRQVQCGRHNLVRSASQDHSLIVESAVRVAGLCRGLGPLQSD